MSESAKGAGAMCAQTAQGADPLVSVIVAVYNTERFLEECLESVLAQSMSDFELICVNDGSTDESAVILARFAAVDARVRVIERPNGGLSAARNTGLDAACGRYVLFLDSDDFIDPTLLERTVEASEAADAQLCVFDYRLHFEDTGRSALHRDQELFARLAVDAPFSLETQPALAGFVGAWDRLYRRDFIEAQGLRFEEGRLYEDVPFWAAALAAAERITLVHEQLLSYRRNVAGSITQGEAASARHKADFLYMQGLAQRRFAAANVADEAWRCYAGYFLDYALMHARQAAGTPVLPWLFLATVRMAAPETLKRLEGRAWAADAVRACPPEVGAIEACHPGLAGAAQGRLNAQGAIYALLVRRGNLGVARSFLVTLNALRGLARRMLDAVRGRG
ncbi:glycosyltransferase [Eggerthellaceae bacterium zg-997]|nr:glycosyltransferase [Eggerthellaceae bacterium zg-997]